MSRKKGTHHPRIGLALGSGAARGWAHIGVLEVLLEAGVPIDIIAGSSAGALVGAAYACGALMNLKHRVLELTMRQVLATMEIRFSRGGIVTGRGIIRELSRLGITGRIEDLPIPYIAVATELVSGAEIWLRRGEVLSAIHASIAMPGFIAPVHRDGHWLLDGGVINPVPVSAVRALGADIIIAVALDQDIALRHHLPEQSEGDPLEALVDYLPGFLAHPLRRVLPDMSRAERAPGYLDVITGAIDIMQAQITRARLAGEPPHMLIRPLLPDVGTFDFDRGEEIIAAGREAAESALPHIQRIIRNVGAYLEGSSLQASPGSAPRSNISGGRERK